MKGDYSQLRFDAGNHFSSVRLQQGRVSLDADWNEQVDIQLERERQTARDLVGRTGAPRVGGGFKLSIDSETHELHIAKGRMYVGGILVNHVPKNGANTVAFQHQPFHPGAALPATDGTYLAYLDVWERHVTAVDDPALLEPALGGPDTTTRTQVVWQVKMLHMAPGATCNTTNSVWTALTAGSGARLQARATAPDSSPNPCLGQEDGGYRGLENQLYRVEIHRGGAGATWKWSRCNGVIVAKVLDIEGEDREYTLTVAGTGRDENHAFLVDKIVEVTGFKNEVKGFPGHMARITAIDGNEITIEPLHPALFNEDDFGTEILVRQWDQDDEQTIPTGWVELENGVEVRFTGSAYFTGDYWVIPARPESADVLWPLDGDGVPEVRAPRGVRHSYARLAVLVRDDGAWSFQDDCADCREQFSSLTELSRPQVVGGDGQIGDIETVLPVPLRVFVSGGASGRAGQTVTFSASDGNGTFAAINSTTPTIIPSEEEHYHTSLNATTNHAGMAAMWWKLGRKRHQHITATTEDGTEVFFTASIASPMYVRAARIVWGPDTGDSAALNENHGTLVELPAIPELPDLPPDDFWHFHFTVDHIKESPFSKANLTVSYEGQYIVATETVRPAFKLTPATDNPVVAYDPDRPGDGDYYALDVSWEPTGELKTWVNNLLYSDGHPKLPLRIMLQYSDNGRILARAEYVVVLTRIPPTP